MKCPKCGKEYTGKPALSRIDGSKICSICGSIEAMDAVGWSEEDKNEVIEMMRQSEENYCLRKQREEK